jgi:hypothetical protein
MKMRTACLGSLPPMADTKLHYTSELKHFRQILCCGQAVLLDTSRVALPRFFLRMKGGSESKIKKYSIRGFCFVFDENTAADDLCRTLWDQRMDLHQTR